jgi:beta-glucuronidase
MIRPLDNARRSARDLSGVWHIAFDPDESGEAQGWHRGLARESALPIAVPGSWNEQLAEVGYMNYVGSAWLETRFWLQPLGPGDEAVLRFGSVDYHAEVWVNGQPAGRSGAAMLPFEVPLDGLAKPGSEVTLVVRVSNLLPVDGPTQRVTQSDYITEGRYRDEYLPAVRFDFFPYGGINRPVHLITRPKAGLRDYRLAIDMAALEVRCALRDGQRLVGSLSGFGGTWRGEAEGPDAAVRLAPDPARLWSPEEPNLYTLQLDVYAADGTLIDRVTQRVGLRNFAVEGRQVLLNGAPYTLKGFGKHEDSPIHGRGLNGPQMIKDFRLLKWCGANSVRTSHYPYAEEFLDLADEIGLLVIDEVFSINLDFRKVNAATLAAHKQAAAELIARDINRTCVIAWSLANEPGYLAEPDYRTQSPAYWRDLFAHARALDSSRPLTHANVGYAGNDDPAFAEADLLMINRYHGWYSEPAQLDRATARLNADFDAIAAHGKPILVAEFGADALAGQHASYDQLFTEEYQASFIRAYWQAITAHPAVVGGHIWAFADFRTAQHGRRVVHNLKGVFTRTREPKLAAWAVRELWRDDG